MLLLTYCNKLDRELPLLLKSVEGKIAYECHIVSGLFSWENLLAWELSMCEKFPGTTLIFVDAYDTLFVGDTLQLELQVKDEGIVYCASKNYWPDEGKKNRFPDCDSPWRFLNGGVKIGKGHAIRDAIKSGYINHPIKPLCKERRMIYYEDNDQRFWTDVYLNGRGSLDTECEIFQNLSSIKDSEFEMRSGKFHNTVTGSYPHFLHAAARTWDKIPKELYERL